MRYAWICAALLLVGCGGDLEPHKTAADLAAESTTDTGEFDSAIDTREAYVLDAYERTAAYVNAAMVDEVDAGEGLSFSISGVTTIDADEFIGHRWIDVVDMPGGLMLNVTPNQINEAASETSYAAYFAKWLDWGEEFNYTDHEEGALLLDATIDDVLAIVATESPEFAQVDAITWYDITVSFDGEDRTYRALTMWKPGEGSEDAEIARMVDYIVQGVDVAVAEHLDPRPRHAGAKTKTAASSAEGMCQGTNADNPPEYAMYEMADSGDEHHMWGEHSAWAVGHAVCSCDTDCNSTCQPAVPAGFSTQECFDRGYPVTVVQIHKKGTAGQISGGYGYGIDDPAECQLAYICAIKECPFGLCGVSVGIGGGGGRLSIQSDPGTLWEKSIGPTIHQCPPCKPNPEGTVAGHCSDGLDNDGDGAVDCFDEDCHGEHLCIEKGTFTHESGHIEEINRCGDTKDNDGDGLIDGADQDCNTPPSRPTVTIEPSDAYTTTNLTAHATRSTDSGTFSAVTYRYAWYIVHSAEDPTAEAVLMIGETESTLGWAGTVKHDIYRVVVTPNDTVEDGPSAEAEITIKNSPPWIDGPTITPDSEVTTSTELVCAATAYDADDYWAGPETLEFTYAWTNHYHEELGTDETLTLSTLNSSPGDTITCTATVTDADGAFDWSTETVSVVNSKPEVVSVSIASTRPYTTDVLTATVTTHDADEDAVELTYVWTVADADDADGGATYFDQGSVLEGATYFERGQIIYLEVTPNDGMHDGVTVKSNEVTVVNSGPSIGAVSISPDPAVTGAELMCSYTGYFDADLDEDHSTFTWTVNDRDEGSARTLSGVFSRGDEVTCTVTPSDGVTHSTAFAVTETVTIANAVPRIDTVSISPNPATTADSLECSHDGFADADGDPDESTYDWKVNGVTAGSRSTPLEGFSGGDVVTCTVTPNDGTDDGEPVTSDPVTISADADADTDTDADADTDTDTDTDSSFVGTYWGAVTVTLVDSDGTASSCTDDDVRLSLLPSSAVVRDGYASCRIASRTVEVGVRGWWNEATETATVAFEVYAFAGYAERFYLRSFSGTPSVDVTGTTLTGSLTDATLCLWSCFEDYGHEGPDLGVTVVFNGERDATP